MVFNKAIESFFTVIDRTFKFRATNGRASAEERSSRRSRVFNGLFVRKLSLSSDLNVFDRSPLLFASFLALRPYQPPPSPSISSSVCIKNRYRLISQVFYFTPKETGHRKRISSDIGVQWEFLFSILNPEICVKILVNLSLSTAVLHIVMPSHSNGGKEWIMHTRQFAVNLGSQVSELVLIPSTAGMLVKINAWIHRLIVAEKHFTSCDNFYFFIFS